MSHKNHIHLVFSTKDRQRLIVKAMQKKFWAYMAGVCKSYDMLALTIGGGCSALRAGDGMEDEETR
jgi:Transposase IS200 like